MRRRFFNLQHQKGFANPEIMMVIALFCIGVAVFIPALHLGFWKALLKAFLAIGLIVGGFALLILGAWTLGWIAEKISKLRQKKDHADPPFDL